MKKLLFISLLFFSQIVFSQQSKDYFVLFTSDPMLNPSAAIMSINTASEALALLSFNVEMVEFIALSALPIAANSANMRGYPKNLLAIRSPTRNGYNA